MHGTLFSCFRADISGSGHRLDTRNAKREGTGFPVPSQKVRFLRKLLVEVPLQHTLQSLAVAGFVAGHLMDGVVNGVKAVLLRAGSQLELAVGRAELAVHVAQIEPRLQVPSDGQV